MFHVEHSSWNVPYGTQDWEVSTPTQGSTTRAFLLRSHGDYVPIWTSPRRGSKCSTWNISSSPRLAFLPKNGQSLSSGSWDPVRPAKSRDVPIILVPRMRSQGRSVPRGTLGANCSTWNISVGKLS